MSGLTSGRIRWIVVLVVVALVAVSTWLILWSPVFTAKHVVIVGADQVTRRGGPRRCSHSGGRGNGEAAINRHRGASREFRRGSLRRNRT